MKIYDLGKVNFRMISDLFLNDSYISIRLLERKIV